MCRRVTCDRCGKPTFAGCGMHVEQVLGDVPKAQRCRCAEVGASEPKAFSAGIPSWLRPPLR
jgi:hypothetical protein